MADALKVHIGAAKTGSSAIQTFIRKNLTAFAAVGCVVPDNRLALGAPVSGNHVFQIEHEAKTGDAASFAAKLRTVSDGSDAHTILLSAENLSNPGRSALLRDAAKAFDTQIILYVRRQDELLTSTWQQWNSKVERDFNAWLIGALRQFGHWDRVLAEWENVVGRDAITVRVFERSDFVDDNLLVDFVDALGFGADIARFDVAPDEVNPSLTDALTALVAGNRTIFANAHDNRFFNQVNELTQGQLIEKRKVSLLTPAQRDKIVEYYRPCNEAVCSTYFPGRGRLFGKVNHEKYRYLASEALHEEQMRVMMTIISFLVDRVAP